MSIKEPGDDSKKEFFIAYMPFVMWLMGGVLTVIISICGIAYNFNKETIILTEKVRAQEILNAAQEDKIAEINRNVTLILSEQTKTSEAVSRISASIEKALDRMLSENAEMRQRMDRHIESGKD